MSCSPACTLELLSLDPELIRDSLLLLDDDLLLVDNFFGSICCIGDEVLLLDDSDDDDIEGADEEELRLESFIGSFWCTNPLEACISLVALSKCVGTVLPSCRLLLRLLRSESESWEIRGGGSEPVLFMIDLGDGFNTLPPLPAWFGLSCVRP